MKVSVIIPAYNAENFIAEALDSVFAQTHRDFEVIVVNDGSTDATARILEAYADRVRCIDQPNRGQNASRATGIEAASGNWIAFLDADDVWIPSKLAKQVEIAERHQEYGIVTTDFLSFSGDQVECASVKEWYAPRCGMVLENLLFGNWITPSAVMVRRDCFNRVRTWDTGKYCFGEDWVMWMQIAAESPVYFIDEVLVKRRIHGANASRNNDEIQFEAILRNFDLLRRFVPELSAKQGLVDEALFRICMNRGRRNLLYLERDYAVRKFNHALSLRRWSPVALAYRALAGCPEPFIRSVVRLRSKTSWSMTVRGREAEPR